MNFDSLQPDGLGPGEREQLRRNFIKDFESKFVYTKKPTLSPRDLLAAKVRNLDQEVKRYIRPILQAGGGFDKQALFETAIPMYLAAFNQFSKDELVNTLSILFTEMLMEFIENNPVGNDKPDLLS